MSISGVPKGWELVRIGKPDIGEHLIDTVGNVVENTLPCRTGGYPIVRKLPDPKPSVDPGEGWRLLGEREVIQEGDELTEFGTKWWASCAAPGANQSRGFTYRRRIATHRPFSNAAEFEPHRDKWIRRKDKDAGRTWKPCYYANDCVWLSSNAEPTLYSTLLEMFEFSDGTPCGVKL